MKRRGTEGIRARTWWQTLPGMLTAAATLITAVTGLIVGLNQAGVLHGEGRPVPPGRSGESGTSPAVSSASTGSGSTTTPAPPVASGVPLRYAVTFPAGAEATAGAGAYRILQARVAPRSSDKLTLTFTVRVTGVRYPGLNFFGNDFRLLVDNVPREPEDAPNLLVGLQSSKDGDVVFVVDPAARHLVLQVGEVGHETSTIPLALTPAPQ